MRPGKRKTDYYSDTQIGFGLECRASGGKSYFQRYFSAKSLLRAITR